MKYRTHSHRFAESIIDADPELKTEFSDIISVIAGLSDQDLLSRLSRQRQAWADDKLEKNKVVNHNKALPKSLSKAINELLKERLVEKDWVAEPGIFRDTEYSKKSSSWRLDFAKSHTSIEVAFNHGEAIAHNLVKPVLASQLNHVEKSIQTRIGVIVTCTESLKKAGNFDNAVGSYEKFISYLKPYQNILTCPIVLIGLEAPDTFRINSKSREIELFGNNDKNPLLL